MKLIFQAKINTSHAELNISTGAGSWRHATIFRAARLMYGTVKKTHQILYVLRSTGNAYEVIIYRRSSRPRAPNILDKSTPMHRCIHICIQLHMHTFQQVCIHSYVHSIMNWKLFLTVLELGAPLSSFLEGVLYKSLNEWMNEWMHTYIPICLRANIHINIELPCSGRMNNRLWADDQTVASCLCSLVLSRIARVFEQEQLNLNIMTNIGQVLRQANS